jgi:hypothetical protein
MRSLIEIWFDKDNIHKKLVVKKLGKYERESISFEDYKKDEEKPGLRCTEKDLYKWGWVPENLQHASELRFISG